MTFVSCWFGSLKADIARSVKETLTEDPGDRMGTGSWWRKLNRETWQTVRKTCIAISLFSALFISVIWFGYHYIRFVEEISASDTWYLHSLIMHLSTMTYCTKCVLWDRSSSLPEEICLRLYLEAVVNGGIQICISQLRISIHEVTWRFKWSLSKLIHGLWILSDAFIYVI